MSDLTFIEPIVRVAAFAASAAVLVAAERRFACRALRPPRTLAINVALLVTNTLMLRIIAVSSLTGIALFAQAQGWGLLALVEQPVAIEILFAIVALDFTLYLQHRLYHRFASLWRLHRVHHSDLDFDLSTGVRFHPGEMLVSFAIKAAAVLLLGAAPLAVLTFEVLLNSSSLFTHANLDLPPRLDAALRRLIVTPAMHRIHHSVRPDEHNRNFGFLLSCWDRWLGSYRRVPHGNPADMPIGLSDFRLSSDQTYAALIRQPLKRGGGDAGQ